MDDPRHRTADALVKAQGSRQRTDFVVTSILTANQANAMEQIVRQAVRDELRNHSMPPLLPEAEVKLSDLPDSLVHAMEEL